MAITIRLASLDDAKALLDIYRYYVEETAITFEYDVPTLEEFTGRMRSIMAFYPYLVAEEDGKILGYDYASKFHPRAAYAWSAEVTVYLDKAARGKGVGRQIYGKLDNLLTFHIIDVLHPYHAQPYPDKPSLLLTKHKQL